VSGGEWRSLAALLRGDRRQEMEKREHPRHTCTGPIIYRQLGPARAGSMHDLNERGLMVMLAERFQVGTLLDLLIFLGERSIRAEAEVVWSQDASTEQATSSLHRLRFTSLDLQDRLSLELFIAVAFSGKGGAGEAVVKEVRPRP
jgi:hypothetical protein